jgi:acyl-coenzyme A thioesterase PaaI-like protein
LTSEVAIARPVGRHSPAARDSKTPSRRIEVEPHNCFACGTLNAHGLHLELHTAADRCWTRLTLSDRFEGWEGIAHGGILAAILDEVMAWALVDHDLWGLTARMSVDFRRPVRVGQPILAEGWVSSVARRGRLIDTAGRIVDAATGELLATAEARYIGATEDRKRELKSRYRFRVVDEGPEDDQPPGEHPDAPVSVDGQRPNGMEAAG